MPAVYDASALISSGPQNGSDEHSQCVGVPVAILGYHCNCAMGNAV